MLTAKLHPVAPAVTSAGSLAAWLLVAVVLAAVVLGGIVLASRR